MSRKLEYPRYSAGKLSKPIRKKSIMFFQIFGFQIQKNLKNQLVFFFLIQRKSIFIFQGG